MIRTFLFTLITAAALSASASASIIDWDDHGNNGDKDWNKGHDHDNNSDHGWHDKDNYKESYNDHGSDGYFAGNWDDHGKKGDHDDHNYYDHNKGHDWNHDPEWKIAECNVGNHDHDHDWNNNGGWGWGNKGNSHCHDPSVSATPLPPALSMFGAALLALGAFAWRRRKVTA